MDKQKTGTLIRNARIDKNYTQSQLGDLLGVSNKAVSRWENGQSFPDVDILENLAVTLDIHIEDIITGKAEAKSETKHRFPKHSLKALPVMCAIISGLFALGKLNTYSMYDAMLVFAFLMCVSYVSALLCYPISKEVHNSYIRAIAPLTFFLSISLTLYSFTTLSSKHFHFGMQLSSVAHILNWLLIALYLINLLLLALQSINWSYYISISTIYLVSLYSTVLHNMSSTDGAIEMLSAATIVVVLFTGIFLVCHKLKFSKCKLI